MTPAAESPTPTASTDTTTKPEHAFGLREDGILNEVLDDLVTDGTITEDQQQAILDALTAERDARVAEAQERADQLRSFLEDGVITQEEFDQLPEDSRLRQLADVMDDGQITTEELQAIGGGLFGGRGHGHGFGPGFGPKPWDGTQDGTDDGSGSDVEPAPTPSAGTSG